MNDKSKYSQLLKCGKIILLEADIKNDTCTVTYKNEDIFTDNFSEKAHICGFCNENDVQFVLDKKSCNGYRSVQIKMPDFHETKWYMLYKIPVTDNNGEITGITGVLCDVNIEKAMYERMIEKNSIDPLTKVYKREAAKEIIEQYLLEHEEDSDYAFFMLDLDNFKIINDTFGHLYGDAVLTMAAGCIKSSVDKSDVIGRFGGDEFFVFIKNSSREEILNKASNIRSSIISMRNNISEDNNISCSIGIAFGEKGSTYQKLFKMADTALYRSKNNGKNCITEYTDDMSNDDIAIAADNRDCEDINENKTKSHDLVSIAIEIAARSTSFQNAVHMIMRHIGMALDVDDVKIMHVNFDEDMISIEHHWTKAENVAEFDRRTGYYIHADIVNLRNMFKEKPLFIVDENTKNGFSEKFSNELKKLSDKSVLYSSSISQEKSFFYLILSCFKPNREWTQNELDTVSEITKILYVYLVKNYKVKTITDNDPLVTEPHTNLLYYDKFCEQSELIRKLAIENNQKMAVIHSDFYRMRDFNDKYGIRTGERVFLEYASSINRKISSHKNMSIATHIYGTDRFIAFIRYDISIAELVEKIQDFNIKMCREKLFKCEEYNHIIKSSVCNVAENDFLWKRIDDAYRLTSGCGELTECVCFAENK